MCYIYIYICLYALDKHCFSNCVSKGSHRNRINDTGASKTALITAIAGAAAAEAPGADEAVASMRHRSKTWPMRGKTRPMLNGQCEETHGQDGICCQGSDISEAQKCPKGEVPSVFVPVGDPWGTLLQAEIRDSRAPVKSPRGGQTLRSPRPKVSSVPSR